MPTLLIFGVGVPPREELTLRREAPQR